jgi:hypothetical protein
VLRPVHPYRMPWQFSSDGWRGFVNMGRTRLGFGSPHIVDHGILRIVP